MKTFEQQLWEALKAMGLQLSSLGQDDCGNPLSPERMEEWRKTNEQLKSCEGMLADRIIELSKRPRCGYCNQKK
jgi:post-segregation antitoxin (ccd killing protein)